MSNERVFRAQLGTRPRSFFAVTRSILNQITRFLTCWNPLFALYRTGISTLTRRAILIVWWPVPTRSCGKLQPPVRLSS
jgi:hypothetical protein